MKIKMLKSLTTIFCVGVVSAALHSEELRPPHRLFEIGADASGGLSNNTVTISDLKKNNLNVASISNSISGNFASLDYNGLANIFINLNLPNGWRFGINTGADISGFSNFGKDMLDALTTGNLSNNSMKVEGNTNLDIFFNTNFSLSFPVKKFRLTFTPSVFAPIMHVSFDNINVSGSVSNNILNFSARGSADVYTSAFNVEKAVDGSSAMFDFNELAKSMGFDLTAAIEAPVGNKLQIGGQVRVPIVPGRLLHGSSTEVNFTESLDMNNYYAEETTNLVNSFVSNLANSVKSTSGTFKLSRPLKLGAEVAYRPFGDWFTVNGMIGMGVRYPYTKFAKFYPEYNVGLALLGWKTIGISLSSGYFNKVFVQELGFVLNARVLELNFAVSAQSSNFVKSFQGAGFGAKLYVAIGVPFFGKHK